MTTKQRIMKWRWWTYSIGWTLFLTALFGCAAQAPMVCPEPVRVIPPANLMRSPAYGDQVERMLEPWMQTPSLPSPDAATPR